MLIYWNTSKFILKEGVRTDKKVALQIGHVLNEQGTGYENIFSVCEHSISIELKMAHVI